MVARVLDGDTLVVSGNRTVRLVGALAPRAFDAGTTVAAWPPAEIARRELVLLAEGKTVLLRFAGRNRSDRYGRWLAQAYAKSDAGSMVWLQGEMVKRGAARAYVLPGHADCLAELLGLEREARQARLGVWHEASYSVRSADDERTLNALHGTFQIVEGRVASVAIRRSRIYLNFGREFRRDFTVTARGKVVHGFAAAKIDPAALKVRRVRVRGWIERRGGPLIELGDARELEVLD